MTKIEKLEAELSAVKQEQEFLSQNSFVIGSQKRLVALCKKHSRLENKIADERYKTQIEK